MLLRGNPILKRAEKRKSSHIATLLVPLHAPSLLPIWRPPSHQNTLATTTFLCNNLNLNKPIKEYPVKEEESVGESPDGKRTR